jgi:CHAD domain-containing protein
VTGPTRLALPADLDLAAVLEVRGLRLVPGSTVERRLSTWDTSDNRLARHGISLSHVDGEWLLRLPDGEVVRAAGKPARVPAELRALTTGWVRAATLRAAHTERVRRTEYRLADDDGVTTARLTEDDVSTVDDGKPGHTRVLTVEAGPADSARLAALLGETGAGPTAPPPAPAPRYGDLPSPRRLSPASGSATVLAQVFATQAERLIGLDLPVRRGQEDAVHQMRVACRRVRAALRTFRPLVGADWARELSAELAWLAGSLGAARDLEVLRARIADIAEVDPHHPVEPAALARIDTLLHAREDAGQSSAARTMNGRRYATLLERVVAAGRSPAVTAAAAVPARDGMLPLVADTWREFARRAGRLGPDRRDPVWHRVRILGKRARYACEAAEPAFGDPARRLAKRLTTVQDILGEHQDAVITADTLLELAHQHPADTELVLACGRLVERERTAAQAARATFHDAWSTVDSPKYTRWLHG